ncbi:MAG: right-handed parallel beta-helix repeat-containing protein [Fibrobacteria bacterium]|nr:right-handed parallel beta-helix repeat-containing protein [Fibrobacteria bacterium]
MRSRPVSRHIRRSPRWTGWLASFVVLGLSPRGEAALPRNAEGWTTFQASADTRLLYVSSSRGDDSRARAMSAGQVPDPFAPSDSIVPFRTFAAALAQTRKGYPDWILVRRGDTLREKAGWQSGRSATEPFLLAAYGPVRQNPVFLTDTATAIHICCKDFSHVAFQGIDFRAQGREYGTPEYSSSAQANGFSIYVGANYTGTDLLIEGCRFFSFSNNTLQADYEGTLEKVVIRRSGFFDNYSNVAHAQGLYTSNLSHSLMEECVFDHNGWFKQGKGNAQDSGRATIFNHDTYSSGAHFVEFRGNMFLRGSSIGTKWTANGGEGSAGDIHLIDNLYSDNEVAISIGGNTLGPYRFKNIEIHDNIFTHPGRPRQTLRTLGWGIGIQEWDSGSVTGNVFAHSHADSVTNVWGIALSGTSRNVRIADNVFWGWEHGTALSVDTASSRRNMVFEGNRVQVPSGGGNLVKMDEAAPGLIFRRNQWYHEDGEKFTIGKTVLDFATWKSKANDSGSTFGSFKLVDPTRTIESFQASQGRPATLQSFVEDVRSQSMVHWRPGYNASSVNAWIRDGYRPAGSPVAATHLAQAAPSAPRLVWTGEGIAIDRGSQRLDLRGRPLH